MQNYISRTLKLKPLGCVMAILSLLALSAPASASLIGDEFDWAFDFDCAPGCGTLNPATSSGTGTGGTLVNTVFDLLPAGAPELPVTMLFGASTLDLTVDLTSFGTLGTSVTWDFSGLEWREANGDLIPGRITNVALTGGNSGIFGVTWLDDSIQIITLDIASPPRSQLGPSISLRSILLPDLDLDLDLVYRSREVFCYWAWDWPACVLRCAGVEWCKAGRD